MTSYDLERARDEWSRPPFDELGYVSSADVLAYTDDELRHLINKTEAVRYSGWRNHRGLWRSTLGLDDTEGEVILDFGCGSGIESLQFARLGNEIILADIVPDNVTLATRVLRLYGYEPVGLGIVGDATLDIEWLGEPREVDIFYANGVIHHSPHDIAIMSRIATIAPEARLMLYSDRGWRAWIGDPVPEGRACEDDRFQQFVRTFDAVGEYADFYDYNRLDQRFGRWWTIESFRYICDDDRYLTAILRRKDG